MNYLPRQHFLTWLDGLKTDYEVFVPVKKGTNRFYQRYTSSADTMVQDIIIGEARTTDPLKGFFTPVREKVAEGFNPEVPAREHKPFAIVGVKACDLTGFQIQDQVFLNNGSQNPQDSQNLQNQSDPLYARGRADNLIIAADCSLALETCFCLALDHKPYPESHFDINLSEVLGGFIVEVGSAKGQQVVGAQTSLFQAASPEMLNARQEQRQHITAEVQRKIEAHQVPHQDQYPGIIERNYDASIWQDEAKRCVECGACNTICPTCHCFLLMDEGTGCQFTRFRQWDACLLKDFAGVAGGGNPRPQLWMRLRNRFEKKFDFFPKVAGVNACSGCGRCISACPANIDIRNVLKRLVDNGHTA